MKLNRRNALIGLGALAVGGGAAFGSGAFSQVSAERTVAIDAAGDAAALLGLAPASSNTRYVSTTNGTLQIDLNETSLGSGEGINFDAITFIEPLFDITNNGSETVGIRLETGSGSPASINNSASTEDSTGSSLTTSAFTNSGIVFNFYAQATGTLSGDNNFASSLTTNQGNSIVGNTFTDTNLADVNLDPDASVEIALGIDTLGVDTSTVSADTELLDPIRVVASSDGV